MEILSVIAIGLTLVNLVGILNRWNKNKILLKKYVYRQSTLHRLAKMILPSNAEVKRQKMSQFNRYKKNKTFKVITAPDGKAYWVKNNKFYYSDLSDGEFDPSKGTEIDTTSMTKKEIDKLLLILDNLNGGTDNDSGSPRN